MFVTNPKEGWAVIYYGFRVSSEFLSSAEPMSGNEFIEKALRARRSLEKALEDMQAKYEREPSPELKKMIRNLELEIERHNNS